MERIITKAISSDYFEIFKVNKDFEPKNIIVIPTYKLLSTNV